MEGEGLQRDHAPWGARSRSLGQVHMPSSNKRCFEASLAQARVHSKKLGWLLCHHQRSPSRPTPGVPHSVTSGIEQLLSPSTVLGLRIHRTNVFAP